MAPSAGRAKLAAAQSAAAVTPKDSGLDQPESEGGGFARPGPAHPPAVSWGNAVTPATARPDAEGQARGLYCACAGGLAGSKVREKGKKET